MKAGQPQPFYRRFYDGWMVVVGRFTFVQTLVILGIFYGLLIGPWGVGAALLRRDLLDKRRLHEPGSAWREPEGEKPSLESAGRQF